MRALALALLSWALLAAVPAAAHKASDSYLRLGVEGDILHGQWDIALRDLDYAIGLDANGDGAITWGELKARHAAAAAYALARLTLTSDGRDCPSEATAQLVDRHSDGAYAVLRFEARCPAPVDRLRLDYGLLFDLDPTHRGLVQVAGGGSTQSRVLSPEHRSWQVTATATPWQDALSFLLEGTGHIMAGLDHQLFIVTLLLGSLLERRGGAWQPVTALRPALTRLAAVITAFTLAHSLSLAVAVLDILRPPAALVEIAIAASILLAALNTLWPLVTRRLWLIAFAFGLIHGFGFASVLNDLGLRGMALVRALASFNIGVELGQLAVVALLLGAFATLAQTRWPLVLAGRLCLVGIMAVAGGWLVERALAAGLLYL